MEGRFPLTDPWWQITCRVGRPRNNRVVLHGFPSYALRSDLRGEASRPLAALFLKACNVAPQHVTQFMDWLPKRTDVGLNTLPELLDDFGEVEQHKTAADHMKPQVSKSGKWISLHSVIHSFFLHSSPRGIHITYCTACNCLFIGCA